MAQPVRGALKVLVVTGDHTLPDPTKWDGRYSPDDIELHEQMRAALESLPGYEFEFLTEHDRLIGRLGADRPDLVLNFCDTGFRNVAAQEIHIPALLEAHGIPYTGAPPAGMVLCYDKAVVRLVAQAHGVPVPHEAYVTPEADPGDVDATFPALVKPAKGDGSVGINRNAVVRDSVELVRQLEWFRAELPGRAALVQEFLPGPEYGMALIGNPGAGFEALPPLEVHFGDLPDDLPPILAFESKTGPETPYGNVQIRAARLPDETVAKIRANAELLFERLSCRDYARFDMRTGADGVIKLMEVNPNPAWSSAGKLAIMAGFGGRGYPETLGMILSAAMERIRSGRGES